MFFFAIYFVKLPEINVDNELLYNARPAQQEVAAENAVAVAVVGRHCHNT